MFGGVLALKPGNHYSITSRAQPSKKMRVNDFALLNNPLFAKDDN